MQDKRDAGFGGFADPAMSLGEAAEVLRLSPWTIRRWAADGRLSTIKLGRRRVVRASELERVLSKGVPPKSESENS